jgi:hypothetical protein
MPEQLTAPPAPTAGVGSPRSSWAWLRPYAVQALLVVAIFAVAGVVAGAVWEWVWTPPTGVVVHHQWAQDEAGLRGDFSGTGTYVAIAALTGLVLGAVVGVVLDRSEVVTLVAALGGSLLAGWLMHRVGVALGPADPRTLAATAKPGAHLPGELIVSGNSVMRAFPGGTLIGLTVVYLGLSRHRANQTATHG